MQHQPPFQPVTPPWAQPAVAPAQPPWVTAIVPKAQAPIAPTPLEQPTAADVKARILAEFEMVFPRVLARVYAGNTVSTAVKELPIPIDYGAFNRWVRKDPQRRALVEEAEEARAEVWADRILEHAEGVSNADGVSSTIERDKLAIDTYKFLMGRQSKKRYGETKVVDVNHTISIAAALAESNQRVLEAEVIHDDTLPEDEEELRLLVNGDEENDDA